MKVNGKNYRSLYESNDKPLEITVVNQQLLPFRFELKSTSSYLELVEFIKDMTVRGAPLIGITGAYAMCLAIDEFRTYSNFHNNIADIKEYISSARPTAVNLRWAVGKIAKSFSKDDNPDEAYDKALAEARRIYNEELDNCKAIGEYGKDIIAKLYEQRTQPNPVNILTHCNAGWLATLDYGTALAPIFAAHSAGIPIHVWVDETRPRNQGARLTAFELSEENVPHTLITDNAGGLLMMQGRVDLVITGADRVSASGDVCNKIGTYLKALSAKELDIPFYVALPTSTIDFEMNNMLDELTIEERSSDEVEYIEGLLGNKIVSIRLTSDKTKAINYGFDITPADKITALVTEKGIIRANKEEIIKIK